MIRQDVLNTVFTALYIQGKPSTSVSGNCRYRGEDNCKCAIGHLIPDASYKPYFEGMSVRHGPIWYCLLNNKIFNNKRNLPFAEALQMKLHDNIVREFFKNGGSKTDITPESFRTKLVEAMQAFAKEYRLKQVEIPVLDEVA